MSYMFYNAKNYNRNMDKWDVGKVVSMQKMFFNARNFDVFHPLEVARNCGFDQAITPAQRRQSVPCKIFLRR